MVLMPALAMAQNRRRAAGLVAFSYYAAASWPIIPSARNFFGPAASMPEAVTLWIVALLLLAIPWLALWSACDQQLARRYAPGKWPVRFILHHLADAETVLFDRIRRIISEPRQVLWAFDQDAWSKGLDYSQTPLDLSRRIYESVRAGVIYQARRHYESSGHLEFIHSETGVRTLKDEFDKVAWHNEHHLAQIELALDQENSSSYAQDAG